VMGIKHPAGFGQPMDGVWPEVWEDIRPLIDSAIDAGVAHFLEDIPFVLRRYGFDELTYFSFSYTPVEDDDGRIAGLMCVLSERTREVQAIAEREQAEERLRASEQALQDANARKDRFLATLAHELRNPLAPIQTATEILRLMPDLDERALRLIDVVERQAKQMGALVEDLIDVSRIAHGLIALRIADVDANAAVQRAVEQLQGKANERRHDVRVVLAPAPAVVRGDAHRLTQIVSNLFANAIRYTPPGGTIGITVTAAGGEVRIDVVDDGEGIAPELLPNLVVPFAHEARSVHRTEGGLGLGLPIVKSLVEAHGGRLEIESAGRGAGSRFTVVLPAPAA
jgi:signal transduction histidine kinase